MLTGRGRGGRAAANRWGRGLRVKQGGELKNEEAEGMCAKEEKGKEAGCTVSGRRTERETETQQSSARKEKKQKQQQLLLAALFE